MELSHSTKLCYYAPIESCYQLYYRLFCSHLVYGCNIWGLTSKENLKKVEVLNTSLPSDLNKLCKLNGNKFLNTSLPSDFNKLCKLNGMSF